MEELIGKITHYFPKVSVGIIALTGGLKVGDNVHFKGKGTDFQQAIDSMQVEHQAINEASVGQQVGVKVSQLVKEGDEVYRVS